MPCNGARPARVVAFLGDLYRQDWIHGRRQSVQGRRWYKIDCSKIFEKPEELPLEPRPVANGGAKVTAIALGLTLPLMEGEPTTYFASRLAARNFLKARPFARGRYGLYGLGSRLRDRDLAVIRDQWSVGCGARGKRLP